MQLPPQQYKQLPRLAWLDIWRVAAASLVFVTHYKPITGRYDALVDEGHIGVALFFVLSGAVLGLQLWHVAPATGLPTQRVWWQGFYLRRFSKIFLLHTLLYLVSLPFIPDDGLGIFLNLTLTKGLVPAYTFSGLQQSWSLTVELMLYMALPIIAWGMQRSLKTTLLLAVGIAILFSALSWYAALYTVAGRSFAFVLGVALAKGWQKPTPLPKGAWWCWLLAILGLLGLMFYLGTLAPITRPHLASTDVEAWLPLTANTVLVPLVFAGGIWLTHPPIKTLHRTMGATASHLQAQGVRLLSLLAQSSYAFYLLHLGPVAKLVYLIAGHNNVLTFAALWIVSIVLHKTLEYPILRILTSKGRLGKKSSTFTLII
jgi:peptidoglycan/LPS O-acetylase OafA/YrhL